MVQSLTMTCRAISVTPRLPCWPLPGVTMTRCPPAEEAPRRRRHPHPLLAMMPGHVDPHRSRMSLPKFHNEPASPEVRIGVTQFACIGVLPPHDHPHIYLTIEDATIVCPYFNAIPI
jgi:uncharacterized Zn-finger protein